MTVQGPIKKQEPDGMSHKGGGGGLWSKSCGNSTLRCSDKGVVLAKGPQKVRGVPATSPQWRLLSHNLHCLTCSPHDSLRNVLLHVCFSSLSSRDGVRAAVPLAVFFAPPLHGMGG